MALQTAPAHGPGLLRNRAFLLLFAAMAVSQLGDALYELVLPIWVLQNSGSAKELALLASAGAVIRLVLAPFAGTLADRTDRRRVMLGADLVRGLVLLLLAAAFAAGWHRFGGLLAGGALLAAASAFFTPAYAASQTGLVHPQDLTRSLSLWQLMRQSLMLAGPALGGLLLGLVGPARALALDGLSFLIAAACVAAVRLQWAPAPPKERRPFWHDLRGGLSLIVQSPVITRTLLLASGVNLAGAAFAVLLPVIALKEMGLSPAAFGLFQAVNPAGAVAGMAVLTMLSHRIARRGRFMLLLLLAMGAANLGLGWATRPAPFLALLFLGGLTFGLSHTMFADIWRRLVPAEQQGRFFALQGAIAQVLAPVGLAAAGLLAGHFSPYTVLAGAGGLVVLLALWGLSGPGLREVR